MFSWVSLLRPAYCKVNGAASLAPLYRYAVLEHRFVAMRPLDEEWAVRPTMLCVRDPAGLPTAARLLVQHLTRDPSS
jgi:hypothetical protein